MASMRSRFDPRYDVNCRLPEKIPIERPGKFTSTRAPSVFTEQPVALNVASAFLISSGVRGSPYTRPSGPGGTLPLLRRRLSLRRAVRVVRDHAPGLRLALERDSGSGTPGTTNGASQNACHLFFSITSGVMSTPRSRSGCALLRRHAPDAALDVELGREILPERRPLPSALPHCELADDRLSVVDRVARAKFRPTRSVPRHGERALFDGRGQTGRSFVLAHIAVERLRRQGRRHMVARRRDDDDRHGGQQHERGDGSSEFHRFHRASHQDDLSLLFSARSATPAARTHRCRPCPIPQGAPRLCPWHRTESR